MNRKFDAGSWQKAASAFSGASGAMGGLKATTLGPGGPTRTDAALVSLARQLSAQLAQAAAGLAGGLTSDAAGMQTTAAAYEAQEAANARTGAKLPGGH